jgi:hypothetical protein
MYTVYTVYTLCIYTVTTLDIHYAYPVTTNCMQASQQTKPQKLKAQPVHASPLHPSTEHFHRTQPKP